MAKKRVNGEGTIGKRKDGRWEARYIAVVTQRRESRFEKAFSAKHRQRFGPG